MGETVCCWIFTASHFSAKGNLASENMEIAPSNKVALQKEKKQIEFSEGLKKLRIIFEGIRPANVRTGSAPVGSTHMRHSL